MIRKSIILLLLPVFLIACGSNDDEPSYPEYDQAYVNFLSQYKTYNYVPDIIETGTNAPFYQLDNDGNIFMQVISDVGNMADNEIIYYDYTTTSILDGHVISSNEGNIPRTDYLYYSASLTPSIITYALQYVGDSSTVKLAIRKVQVNFEVPYIMEIRYMPVKN
jgi:hypothetical protein